MLLFYVVGYVLLNHTKLGAHIYATGANHTAARLAGVPVNWVIRITLMLSGVSVALAASMVTARGNITILYDYTIRFSSLTGKCFQGGRANRFSVERSEVEIVKRKTISSTNS